MLATWRLIMLKLFLPLLFLTSLTYSQVVGTVVSITDGDTFVFYSKESNAQIKVRLHGIDAPEKKQSFGNVSKNYLAELIFQKQVTVTIRNLDKYGRSIGIVFVDGLNVNEKMLEMGMAWHFLKYDNNPLWDNIQNQAIASKIGLWKEDNPTPPWVWRKIKQSY